MANVKQMSDYFHSMAKGKVNQGEMYVINQKGRGIGNARRGKVMYPISQRGAGETSVISPVAQGIVQAQSKVQNNRKRKRSQSRGHSSKRRRTVRRKKISKGQRKKKKKIYRKTRQSKKRHIGPKKRKTAKTTRRRKIKIDALSKYRKRK